MSEITVTTKSGVSVELDEWNRTKALADAALEYLRANEAFNKAVSTKDRERFKELQDSDALGKTWDALVAAGRAFEPFEHA
jgi:hypothetical protein